MCANKIEPHAKPNLLKSVFGNKCSRCRRGDIYQFHNPYHLKTFMKMNDVCPVCGQPFEIEPGFWYGTSYVSYAFSVAICVATFIAWKVLIGMSLNDNRFFEWMVANAVILIGVQPLLMRFARTVWLNFFIWYDPATAEIPDPSRPAAGNIVLSNPDPSSIHA